MTIDDAKLIIFQAQMAAYPNAEHAKQLGALYALIEELDRYKQAEQEGRLVLLPCKVGDTVWAYDDVFNQIAPYQVDMVEIYGRKGMSFCSNWRKNGELMADLDFDVDDIGKTAFLTREEADAALAKKGGREDE